MAGILFDLRHLKKKPPWGGFHDDLKVFRPENRLLSRRTHSRGRRKTSREKKRFKRSLSNQIDVFAPKWYLDGDLRRRRKKVFFDFFIPARVSRSRLPLGFVRIKQSIYMCFRLSYFHFIHRARACVVDLHTSIRCHFDFFLRQFGSLDSGPFSGGFQNVDSTRK